MKRLPPIVRRLLALSLGLGLGLGLCEVGLRAGGVRPPRLISKRLLHNRDDPAAAYHCYSKAAEGEIGPAPAAALAASKGGPWRLLTSSLPPEELPPERLAETPLCVEYRKSSRFPPLDLRGPDPPKAKRRLVVLGDSFVFGEGVPAPRTLPRQLGGLLPGTEVINAGQPGLDTEGELLVLSALLPHHPERALLVFVPNDVKLTPALAGQQHHLFDLINLRDRHLDEHLSGTLLASPLRTLQVLSARLALFRITRETIGWYLDAYDPAQNRENLRDLALHFLHLASAPGCRVAVVLYPLLEDLDGDYPLAPVHQVVAEMVRRAGLPVLDLAPALSGPRTRTLWVHPADHHPSGRAHELAARAIADWLGKLPGFLGG